MGANWSRGRCHAGAGTGRVSRRILSRPVERRRRRAGCSTMGRTSRSLGKARQGGPRGCRRQRSSAEVGVGVHGESRVRRRVGDRGGGRFAGARDLAQTDLEGRADFSGLPMPVLPSLDIGSRLPGRQEKAAAEGLTRTSCRRAPVTCAGLYLGLALQSLIQARTETIWGRLLVLFPLPAPTSSVRRPPPPWQLLCRPESEWWCQ